MIIIKTKTGDVFVNDKDVMEVIHDRQTHTVHINKKMYAGLKTDPPIEHVESVSYVNDQSGNEWKDNGSQIAYLQKQYAKMKDENHYALEMINKLEDNLRQFACEMINIVQHYNDQIPTDICVRIRNRGEKMKSIVNDDEEKWFYRHEWMEAHRVAEASQADATHELNNIIEEQAATIRQLKKEKSIN